MSFQRLRIDMHFSALNFCVLSHEVAKMVDPKMCRFWSSCRQGFNHRTAGLRVSLVVSGVAWDCRLRSPTPPLLWLVREFTAHGYKATTVSKFMSTQPVRARARTHTQGQPGSRAHLFLAAPPRFPPRPPILPPLGDQDRAAPRSSG